MSEVLKIEEFIDKYENEKFLLIDSRSEKEFEHAHIPGAVNIPLLNNDHRQQVGIEYKKHGKEAAVALGFKLVGPHFHEFISKTGELTDKKEVLIYCWRGGMRSSIMSWILSMSGYNVSLLEGGYKSFRNFILHQFSIKKNLMIVGGHTGVGKTEILKVLQLKGEQVIDLEHLAQHKGSAFGALGMEAQPSTEYFENLLGLLWRKLEDSRITWLEAESHTIGKVNIPLLIFSQLQEATLLEINASADYRKKRILDEYGKFPKAELLECTKKLRKRLGYARLMEALDALEENRMSDWLDVLIEYYDKTYSHSLSERKPSQRIQVMVKENENIESLALRLINNYAQSDKRIVA